MDLRPMFIFHFSWAALTRGLICCFHLLTDETGLCHDPLYSKAACGLLWLLVYVVLFFFMNFVYKVYYFRLMHLNSCLQKEVEKALEVWESIEENPTNKQLSFVAKEIAVDQAYVYLAGQLDVSWTDIKIIEVDYRGDVKRISLETLVKWMELKATEATVYALLKGLLSIDRHDVIVKFDKQFCNN